MKKIPCKIFAPASVANVAVGYDILGFPIHGLGDEIIIKAGKVKGLTLSTIHGNRRLSKDITKNVAGYCAQLVLEHLGLSNEPIEIELFKNMPIGTGLGSSAASCVAGAYAVNEYFDRPLKEKDLLPFVTRGEELADGSYHADNVAPSLLGGIILIRDNATLDILRLPNLLRLKAVVVYPHVQVLTKDSRSILNESLSLENHITQSGNLAAFVAALYRSDLELIRRSLQDVLIEPQRAKLIPLFYQAKSIALSENALGFSISGAGPSMFALCQNSFIAENIGDKLKELYHNKGIESTIYISDINQEGAIRY